MVRHETIEATGRWHTDPTSIESIMRHQAFAQILDRFLILQIYNSQSPKTLSWNRQPRSQWVTRWTRWATQLQGGRWNLLSAWQKVRCRPPALLQWHFGLFGYNPKEFEQGRSLFRGRQQNNNSWLNDMATLSRYWWLLYQCFVQIGSV